jgi:hypothetical protein
VKQAAKARGRLTAELRGGAANYLLGAAAVMWVAGLGEIIVMRLVEYG